MRKLLYSSILVLGAFLSSCTVHYVPLPYPVAPGAVPDLKGNQAVCVVNISTASGEILLGTSAAGYKYMGNLSTWTEKAVDLLKFELHSSGFFIRECGKDTKQLKLSVTKAQIVVHIGSKCLLELYLETGDGYSQSYKVSNSYITSDRASDEAITKAIIALLNDKRVIDYLQTADKK
jgi:hypothetical protein